MDTNAYERPLILAPVGGAEQLKAALRTGAATRKTLPKQALMKPLRSATSAG